MPKRVVPISDLQANKAKQKQKDYKLFDGGGLYLLATKTGGKLWRLKYRFDEKERLIAFGGYPEVSLQEARKQREEARAQVAIAIDSFEAKKAGWRPGLTTRPTPSRR